MIRKFTHIKSFGSFGRFYWTGSLPEFSKFNLFYGWNYSGKTTLSRVFRCFEQGARHPDFASAEAQMQTDDGTSHDLSFSTTPPVIRVFNSDFVRDNLVFDDCSATPILVLGAEDIAKQATLKASRDRVIELTTNRYANLRKKDDTKTAIDKALTKWSRDQIKTPFSIPNYDKTRFEPRVKDCKDRPSDFVLSDESVAQLSDVYRSRDKKPSIPKISNTLSALFPEWEKVASALRTTVTANRPISRLAENPSIAQWVDQGRHLHEGKKECQFCNQPLPSNLLQSLAEHFSAEYESLMDDLRALLEELGEMEQEDFNLGHKSDFYPELADRYTASVERIKELLRRRKTSLESLASSVRAKQTKALSVCDCSEVDDPDKDISSAIEVFNAIIAEHNARTEEFELQRQQAFEKLERHFAARFVIDESYNERVQECADLGVAIEEQQEQIRLLNAQILTLEQDLSEAAKGAERINILLRAYFGKDDLRITVSADNRFSIVRGGVIAKNLSEGEKTALAFAYFITKVQDGRNALTDTVVVIDDPVSSLDASHIFNTYALIKTQLATSKQLFITTHSFEFYNLVKEWAVEDDKNKLYEGNGKHWRIFLVSRGDDGLSTVERIPKELLRFKSEYHYLFSFLYRYEHSTSTDFNDMFSLPNVVRRFMEAFGGIMIPTWEGLRSKMVRLFPDEIERERVWKFINQYSHNTTIARSLSMPDISECKAVVESCLRAVEQWNPDYFADLVTEVTTTDTTAATA